ncbi:unknown [Clostridium sp. CAG:762]|nr:unknown [Clostridium sp. CAG:762]
MKNKKIIYIISSIIIVFIIVLVFVLLNHKKNDLKNDNKNQDNSKNLVEALMKKNNEADYKKISNGEMLTEDTSFSKYSFINNNSIYVFNPSKLDSGEFVYKKVYDIDKNIKVMNITPNDGADIKFYDYNDTIYTLHDDNTDNKIRDSYDMYLNANYKLSDYLKWEYSTEFLGKKIDYDFMSNYFYVKDNILYFKNYGNEKYPTIEKVSGNYEGEQVSRIYNERILKTDKAFYELMSYFDTNLNKTVTTTVRINLLTKYYDEILTFTYKYVILKDYTIIPINDVMENRVRNYSYDYFLSGFNHMNEVRYEE